MILIDPGHVGGKSFDLRSIRFSGVELKEGEFCWIWAKLTKERLLAAGIQAELSRGQGQPSKAFSKADVGHRKAQHLSVMTAKETIDFLRIPRELMPEMSDEELLDLASLNELDLFKRVELFNSGRFDFGISLHLNGDPNVATTNKNGICGFASESSIGMAAQWSTCISKISEATDLPLLTSYLDYHLIAPGVFRAPHLKLMALTSRPTLLIEGPFQNNPVEHKRLTDSLRHFLATGEATGRLSELVDGVCNGLQAANLKDPAQ
jgi:N-acetylmuramoyl-L-alanine amidase